MSGTIFGLGLSQRVDSNGQPDIGWKLYLYEAASDTPVISYKDTGLTVGLENPWPIEADSSGMMPQFWLADGSYRVRATSNDGSRIFFDLDSVLALGASSGSGGGGGGVDPNAIYQTGYFNWQPVSGTRAGWVRSNARTIGSSTSGASERANADCEPLFLFGWGQGWSVVSGAGASAAADWAANKQITLPDMRSRGAAGLDDMGNSAASRLAGVPFTSGDATTAGALAGEARHTITVEESATLTYSSPVNEHGGHGHRALGTPVGSNPNGLGAAPTDAFVGNDISPTDYYTNAPGSGLPYIEKSESGVTVSTTADAGDDPHNNTPLVMLGTWFIKL